jgi:antitoxin FitA
MIGARSSDLGDTAGRLPVVHDADERATESHAGRRVPWRDLLALIATGRAVVELSAVSIRNLDDRVKERLRVQAARHGRSMEAEIREILTDAVSEAGGAGGAEGLFEAILYRFGEAGGVELDLPPRTARVRAADFR